MNTNNDGFSLVKLLVENELKQRAKKHKISDKKVSNSDINGVADTIKDSISEQTINLNGDTYIINGAETKDNTILLWLWSDSSDDEKTIKITLKIDELDVDLSRLDE